MTKKMTKGQKIQKNVIPKILFCSYFKKTAQGAPVVPGGVVMNHCLVVWSKAIFSVTITIIKMSKHPLKLVLLGLIIKPIQPKSS